MRTLLRNVSTGLYFQGPDKWTRNPAEALDFKLIDRAVRLIESLRLQGVELAFAFDGQEQVTGVPLERLCVGYSRD